MSYDIMGPGEQSKMTKKLHGTIQSEKYCKNRQNFDQH